MLRALRGKHSFPIPLWGAFLLFYPGRKTLSPEMQCFSAAQAFAAPLRRENGQPGWGVSMRNVGGDADILPLPFLWKTAGPVGDIPIAVSLPPSLCFCSSALAQSIVQSHQGHGWIHRPIPITQCSGHVLSAQRGVKAALDQAETTAAIDRGDT